MRADLFAALYTGGEVALVEGDALEGAMACIDAGVEHGDRHAPAGIGRGVRADRRNAPAIALGCRAGLGLAGERREQDGRHHRADAPDIRITGGGVASLAGAQLGGFDARRGQIAGRGAFRRARALEGEIAGRRTGAGIQIAEDDIFLHGNGFLGWLE